MQLDAAIARFRQFYDTFSAAWIDRLPELYAPGFHFRDPFHAVEGDFATLATYFSKILTALAHSQFITEDAAIGDDGVYIRWRWEWKRKPKDELRVVPGVTHLRFTADGQISYHRDLFDAAEGFYEALPVIGGVLRSIKKRL